MSLPTVAIVLSGNALNLHVPSGTTVKCPLLVDGHLPSLTMTTRDPTLAGTAVGGQQPTLTLIDSTGWRKLHLGVDADTHEVVAVELTQDDVGDVSELVGLLDQVAGSH